MAFNFGTSSSTPAPASAGGGGFSFGSSGSGGTSAPAGGGFSFGATAGDKSSTMGTTFGAAPATGGFTFGGIAMPSSSGLDSNATSSTIRSSFGGGNAPAPVSSVFGSASSGGGGKRGVDGEKTSSSGAVEGSFGSFGGESKTGGFSFGGGSSTESNAPTAGGFSFGGAAAPVTVEAQATATGGFSFGGASSTTVETKTPATGGFNFGGAAPAPPAAQAPTAGGFSFGGALSATVEAKTPSASEFSFGGAAPAPPAAQAPTAGGFSFGGATPATVQGGFSLGGAAANDVPATSDGGMNSGGTATSQVPASAASSIGGLSFSVAAPTSSANREEEAPKPLEFTATTATSTRGFSFGGTTQAEVALTSPVHTSVAQPTGGISLDRNKTADTAGPTLATPSVTATSGVSSTEKSTATLARAKEPNRLEYQTLTVEQILNKFQKELESDAADYMKQAHRVMQYDAVLRDSQRSLSHMSQQTSKLIVQQVELEQLINGIGAFQSELDSNLQIMEAQVDDLFRAQAHLTPVEADRKREQAYNTAVEVDGRISLLTTNLRSSLRQLDGAQETVITGEVGDVCRIINLHQSQLEQLERTTRSMDHDIKQLEQMMASTSR